eukprot:TRINITY_DN16429_c0_g1_i3.p1 TRINITY_DN16429_c0_g1~~TRINITY_DN16429_c0_g1_i3.p1  ORF type:complete len:298 (+),score=90.55 TRINITY_DN16429_c0_g1_i3:124-1017(+)
MVVLARISWIRERIAAGAGVSFSCSYNPSTSTHKVTVRAYHAQSLQHINFLADSFLASTVDILGDLVSSDKGHRHSSDVSVIILYFRRRGVQTFAAGEDESNSEGFTENRGDTSDSWFNSWGSTNGQPSSWYHAPQQQVLVEQQEVLAEQRKEIVEQKGPVEQQRYVVEQKKKLVVKKELAVQQMEAVRQQEPVEQKVPEQQRDLVDDALNQVQTLVLKTYSFIRTQAHHKAVQQRELVEPPKELEDHKEPVEHIAALERETLQPLRLEHSDASTSIYEHLDDDALLAAAMALLEND